MTWIKKELSKGNRVTIGVVQDNSGSVKVFFSFDPSANNISALIVAGQVYFNIHTTYPAGEIRGQLKPMTSDPQRWPPLVN
jgi:hypothetical protein